MMSKIVDARGLNCPQPVILTKRAMDQNPDEEIVTLVDNVTAVENVSRLAKSQNYDVAVTEKDGHFSIHMIRTGEFCEGLVEDHEKVTIMITGNLFGKGPEELGQILMKSFMFTLTEIQAPVTTLIFINSGVYLTVEGSPALEHLQNLEQQGCEILSCGTCLDYYNLKEKLAVGQVTNMYTAVEKLLGPNKSLIL
ncbi:MAG: sulfurtransferase-like selenium metabolism protein YedF [Syntrophomonadaceae bacterium]|nr:sulfurtransferase-like selenium metabolism protein YedF [Syntrophomonadaceae bacterium]